MGIQKEFFFWLWEGGVCPLFWNRSPKYIHFLESPLYWIIDNTWKHPEPKPYLCNLIALHVL